MGVIRHFRDLQVYQYAMEAAETQVWIEFAVKCGHLSPDHAEVLDHQYENIQGKIINMIRQPEKWIIN